METESGRFLSTQFMRCRWGVGVLWAVFTICHAILTAVLFLEDQWIGDTPASRSPGNFGLWRWCSDREGGDQCHGSLADFSSLLSPAARAATVFTGLSVITSSMTVIAFFLFVMCSSADVFRLCGSLQLSSGVFLAVGGLSFPAGWDSPKVRGVCGPQAGDYSLGTCDFRWAALLAVIAFLDAVILGLLALTLASRQLGPSSGRYTSYAGEVNPGFLGDNQSMASRKSLPLQPVMLMPHTMEGERGGADYRARGHPTYRARPGDGFQL